MLGGQDAAGDEDLRGLPDGDGFDHGFGEGEKFKAAVHGAHEGGVDHYNDSADTEQVLHEIRVLYWAC